MNQQLVCSWLGLTTDAWPVDHYTLLGLKQGEADVALIEDRVHERLMKLRPYQLNHPEQVTEAMNRLARAFTCLTDPQAKMAYDASLLGGPVDQPPSVEEPPSDSVDPLAWMFGPWSKLGRSESAKEARMGRVEDWTKAPPPARLPLPSDLQAQSPEVVNGASAPSASGTPTAGGQSPAPAPDPMAAWVAAAKESPSARRGLATRRALYNRIVATRQLLATWQKAGKYLNQPDWRMTRAGEARELLRLLQAIRRLLPEFPPILGEPGQPGFWVTSLARQPMVIPIFRSMVQSQRETLARDWRDSRSLIHAHHDFLRQELHAWRKKTWYKQLGKSVAYFFREHPIAWLVVIVFAVVLILDTAAVVWLMFQR
jgi:hypothetical protein